MRIKSSFGKTPEPSQKIINLKEIITDQEKLAEYLQKLSNDKNHITGLSVFLFFFTIIGFIILFIVLYHNKTDMIISPELELLCPTSCKGDNTSASTQGETTQQLDIGDLSKRISNIEEKLSNITYSNNDKLYIFNGPIMANDFIIHKEKEPGVYENISFNKDGMDIINSLVSKVFPTLAPENTSTSPPSNLPTNPST